MSLKEKVKFDSIRYANVWEDANVLIEAMQLAPGATIASIASAGDNVFALLLTDPEKILAFDINPVQLYLCELKVAAIRTLNRDAAISFLGFSESNERLEQYEQIKNCLSAEALNYWNTHTELITSGVIHQGKFERYFRLFSSRILPFIHPRSRVATLFENKTEQQQLEFYEKHWNTWRWRLFFRIFFSRTVMGKRGRDPEFLRQVEGKVSSYIFRKAENHLKTKAAQENPILYYNLTGTFGTHLPLYLQEEHYTTIRARLDRIEWKLGALEEVLGTDARFDAYNLSDIFEYMDIETFVELSNYLLVTARPGAVVVYWNLMVPRRMSNFFPQRLEYQEERSKKLTKSDTGFFYNCVIIDAVNEG